MRLAVIPAESDAFPRAARAVSARLAVAKVPGIDETQVSKVSLEVVQLSVECVEPTNACYDAIGRSMAVNRLLFARLDTIEKRSAVAGGGDGSADGAGVLPRGIAKHSAVAGGGDGSADGPRGIEKRQLKVTVTLYDVDARTAMRTATKLFASEAEASSGAAALVDEVAQ